jgi:hypothetical protein
MIPSLTPIYLPFQIQNGNPFADFGLLNGTCSFDGLNISKEGYGSTPSICNNSL